MTAVPPSWRKWSREKTLLLGLGSAVAALGLALGNLIFNQITALVQTKSSLALPSHTAQPPRQTTVVTHSPVPPRTPPVTALDNAFVVKSILAIPGPIKFGSYYWDETKGEPGPLVITVDLAARVLSVFENGHEIGATAILKGYGVKPTPTGVFPITQKDATHISNIFDAPMPYMLRLTNDGVSIHGSKVERGYATNGCVGVPEPFAKKLFRVAHLGDKVIITDGKQIKVGDPIMNPPKS